MLGSEPLESRYRIWYVDHAMHTGAEPMPGMALADTTPARKTRMVSYLGVLQQALRDLANWVEHDVVPPASTDFELVDGQIEVPATAKARKGVQAVVDLTATHAFAAGHVLPRTTGHHPTPGRHGDADARIQNLGRVRVVVA